MTRRALKLGLLVNPLAGLGGSVALKGSDGAAAAEALERGARPQATDKAARALRRLAEEAVPELLCWGGDMGAAAAAEAGLEARVIGAAEGESSPEDTMAAARALADAGVDLLLFAGGDGTARDICAAVGERLPVLGIPAGCKMHSGVYAVNPEAAGALLAKLSRGELINLDEAEVRDIDEEAFRAGRVVARTYGSLRVPAESSRLLQQVKSGGAGNEDLARTDLAARVVEDLEDDTWYLMGSGSTVEAVMEELGLPNTLLGVDLVRNEEVVAADVTADEIRQYLADGAPARAVITVIGGQGHLFGRGNQQFSPEVIRRIGRENLLVVATRNKLQALEGRPLLVDTGDPELDRELCGLLRVLTGYEDEVLYPVDNGEGANPAGEATGA
jgi:predicted polyphosphate/ATP-dependent NAD kinase